MRKISLILQEILKFALIFLLSYIWIRYFVRKFWLALLFSVLLAAALYGAYLFSVRKKHFQNALRLKEKEDAENMFLSLALENQPMDFFAHLASSRHENVKKHKEYLTITYSNPCSRTPSTSLKDFNSNINDISNSKINSNSRDNSNTKTNSTSLANPNLHANINSHANINLHTNSNPKLNSNSKVDSKANFDSKANSNSRANSKANLKINSNSARGENANVAVTVLYADFSFEGLTVSRFLQIYNKIKKEKPTKIVIVCKSVDKALPVFTENFAEKILLLDEYQTYQSLYKLYNIFPPITQRYAPAKKMAWRDFMAFSFNKKRTKGYLFSALVLIISSLFIRPTIYYCIVASLLVVFAIISQFNPYFNKSASSEVL